MVAFAGGDQSKFTRSGTTTDMMAGQLRPAARKIFVSST